MFGFDTELRGQVREIAIDQGTRLAAVINILIEKGIVSEAEFERTLARTEAQMDQALMAAADRKIATPN